MSRHVPMKGGQVLMGPQQPRPQVQRNIPSPPGLSQRVVPVTATTNVELGELRKAMRDLLVDPMVARHSCDTLLRAAEELRAAAEEIDREGDAASVMTYDELAGGFYRSANLLRERAAELFAVWLRSAS